MPWSSKFIVASWAGPCANSTPLIPLPICPLHCIVALGIDIEGTKHPLAIEEGSTENATLVTDLITGLRERGLDVTRPILAVLDGSKALSRAVRKVFDQPLIQRCQQHYADLGIMPTRDVEPLVAAV